MRAVATRHWTRRAACHPEVQLPDRDNSPLLLRLLTVTSASRDAFAEAAYVVRSPRLAALFVRRAQHQARIAAFLAEHLTPGSVPVADPVLAKTRGAARALIAGAPPGDRDPYALLGACIRVLDSAILEFCRAYGPTMPLAQRISLERHHDQMRWSREELLTLRRSYKSTRFRPAQGEVARPLGVSDQTWFGAPASAVSPAAWLMGLIPSGGEGVGDLEGTKAS